MKEIYFDYGERSRKPRENRGIESVLREIGPVGERRTPGSLVVLRSLTASAEGKHTYPTMEQLLHASDKLDLYKFARREGIATPLTFPLSYESIVGPEFTPLKLGSESLDVRLGGTIIKPRLSVGIIRDICQAFYPNSLESWEKIYQDVNASGASFVLQEKIDGEIKKVYGTLGGAFFSVDEGTPDDNPQPCPPTIQNLCNYVFDHYGLRWGGLDFIRKENGVWYLIDINPTSGGRRIPEEYYPGFKERMQRHLMEMQEGVGISSDENPQVGIVIQAAGKNSRLRSVVGDTPKSLYPLDDGSTVLSRLTSFLAPLVHYPGFHPRVIINSSLEKKGFFDDWLQAYDSSYDIQINTSYLDGTNAIQNSGNEVLAFAKDSSLPIVLSLAADRLIDVPEDELIRCGEKLVKFLQEDKAPYVLIGARGDSEYDYEVSRSGTIVRRIATEGTGFRKFAVAFDMRKLPLDFARNSKDIIAKLLSSNVHGKLITLNKVFSLTDLDTPEDLSALNRAIRDLRENYTK